MLLVLVVAALLLVGVAGFPSPERVRLELAAGGGWAPLVAILGIAVLAVLVFPRAGIAVLAGLLFGPWTATLYAVVGTVLGAVVAFGIGRALGRAELARITAGHLPDSRLVRLDDWLARRGLLAVVSARLLPVVPFGLFNYGFGATRVGLLTFVVGTTVGILPSTALYAVVGASATEPASPTFLISTALAAAAAVAAAMLTRRSARKQRTADGSAAGERQVRIRARSA